MVHLTASDSRTRWKRIVAMDEPSRKSTNTDSEFRLEDYFSAALPLSAASPKHPCPIRTCCAARTQEACTARQHRRGKVSHARLYAKQSTSLNPSLRAISKRFIKNLRPLLKLCRCHTICIGSCTIMNEFHATLSMKKHKIELFENVPLVGTE